MALREVVTQLVEAQNEQKAQYEKQAELVKELTKESQNQQQAIATLKAVLEKSVQKPTYCEAVKGGQEQGTKKAHLITQSG